MNIKQEEEHALSNDEIMNLVNHKSNIMTYPELANYDDIDQVLGKYGCCIILYLTSENYGHWVCVFKENNIIEHFDSYGLKPDAELKFRDIHMMKQLGQSVPYLTHLLLKCDYPVTYNQYKLQGKQRDIATCGRWVGARIINRKMLLPQFIKMFKGKPQSPDELVTIYTEQILNSK